MEFSVYNQEEIMKFEKRIRSLMQQYGTDIFINNVHATDNNNIRYEAWLLTFGLLDTYITLKQVDLNDDTY